MEKRRLKLPTGISTFEEIRNAGYVYVDKTQYLVRLIDTGKIYFLARPRRFGKSLTVSTFDALFSGRKELFKGLFAEEFLNRPEFKPCPVISLDMSKVVTNAGMVGIRESIVEQISTIAKLLDVSLPDSNFAVSENFARSPGDVDTTPPEGFLYQAGYLTLRERRPGKFLLDYPNTEVLNAMSRLLVQNIVTETSYNIIHDELTTSVRSLKYYLQKNNEFMKTATHNFDETKQKPLTAKHYYSGFPEAHDTYNAISAASDGKIYYVLSSARHDVGGQFYVYDPATDQTKFIADLSEAVGEKGFISQGKSHVEFYEHDGKLYFATHVGYYEMIDGSEQLPKNAPEGYKLYPGGHFVSYDMKSGQIESLALAPHDEGILTMTMDKPRGHLYGITWPKGYLIDYDLKTKQLKDLGLVNEQGEGGIIGKDYRVICRSMFVDPRDGNVYYSTAEGDIFFYCPGMPTPEKITDVDLRIDHFGCYDFTGAGSMGYNWRKIFWYEPENMAYGVHGNSGYLFRFDPKAKQIELVERIVSEPSKKSGMYDQFSYGYLGFMLGKDHTIYYLTGGPIYKDGKRVKGVDKIAMGAARGLENLHLVTYNIPKRAYRDHGAIFYEDGELPTYVNSIAQDYDGNIYTLARFIHEGKEIEDLVKINMNGRSISRTVKKRLTFGVWNVVCPI